MDKIFGLGIGLFLLMVMATSTYATAYTYSISDNYAVANKMYVCVANTTLRYVGGTVGGYQTSEFVPFIIGSNNAAFVNVGSHTDAMRYYPGLPQEQSCPKTNGVPICV